MKAQTGAAPTPAAPGSPSPRPARPAPASRRPGQGPDARRPVVRPRAACVHSSRAATASPGLVILVSLATREAGCLDCRPGGPANRSGAAPRTQPIGKGSLSPLPPDSLASLNPAHLPPGSSALAASANRLHREAGFPPHARRAHALSCPGVGLKAEFPERLLAGSAFQGRAGCRAAQTELARRAPLEVRGGWLVSARPSSCRPTECN